MERKSVVKVNVTWGRNSLSTDMDLTEDLLTFQKHLQILTKVPVKKQKIVVKEKGPKVIYTAKALRS